jgi:hydroxymethylglutaryl-CoA reductase
VALSSRIPGFYRLAVDERRARLADAGRLAEDDHATLDAGGLDLATADSMIENVIGRHALPLGLALNFRIDGEDYLVPMAIEEPSVVAAASGAARLCRDGGGFTTEATPPIMIGQVQLVEVADPAAAVAALELAAPAVLERARALCPGLVARGGGPTGLEARVLAMPGTPEADGGAGMIVVHVLVDCRDAMGANLVNSIVEGLADELAAIAGGAVGLRILSNLAVHRRVTVRARVPLAALGAADDGVAVARAIVAASRFAELDPFRATTHNKGLMNGVDAVLVATGQDWRGVEAGAHAYAARGGRYAPLATWRRSAAGDALVGELTMPMAVGTVGGALHLHAGARLALALVAARSADELARVAAAAGLASNLAALRALATDGIQKGHMALHARVVARAAGARGPQIEAIAAELARLGEVKPARARAILARLRAEPAASEVVVTLADAGGNSMNEVRS